MRRVWIALAAALLAVLPTSAPAAEVGEPLPRAHAHNDYLHPNPLADALSHGFTSVEADVFLVRGRLLVAHERETLDPARTLEDLYLKPLAERVRRNDGTVFPGSDQPVLLWIDIKADGLLVYARLNKLLRRYASMLSGYDRGEVTVRAVTVIVSGDRPIAQMRLQRTRFAFLDGRLNELGIVTDPALVPFLSDDWTSYFTWKGNGPMPVDQRLRLDAAVAMAHAHNQRVRFWATPDAAGAPRAAVWRELLRADVDLINTDDLPALRAFLRRNADT